MQLVGSITIFLRSMVAICESNENGRFLTQLGLAKLRGCLHDIGATFIPARVHSGSLLWLCIRLHDTNTKCHAGASHTGASSPRFLCWSEIFIPARKLVPVSCKRGMTVRFIPIKVSLILRFASQQTRLYVNMVQHFISPRNESRVVCFWKA